MKLKTSFFNPSVLKKDLTRFAPVWGLYCVFLLLLFLGTRLGNPVLAAADVTNNLRTLSWVNLIYAGIAATMLFGDLFQTRLCNALHAMPLTRDGWFFNHALAGLLFSLVPNLIATAVIAVVLGQYAVLALTWLAVNLLCYLFFFGLAAVSVMLAGNRLGMVAIYGVINGFSLLVYALVKEIYEPLLYGLEFVSDPYLFFCPVMYLAENRLMVFGFDYINDQWLNGRIEAVYPQVWIYLIVCGVLGIALAWGALGLYRKRKLEAAGDFIAFRFLEPVFSVIYTLACGAFLHLMSESFGFSTGYPLLGIGVLVGYFTGQMLIRRTVRVFRGKTFLRFAIFVLALGASLLAAWTDPLGITRYAPEADDVEFLRIYQDSDRYQYGIAEYPCYQLETPEEIETFRQVHLQLTQEKHTGDLYGNRMYVFYKLKSGREVKRYYVIDANTAAYDQLQIYFSDYRYLFNANTWEQAVAQITDAELSVFVGDNYKSIRLTDPADIRLLLEAVRKDCDAGNLAQSPMFHPQQEPVGWIYLTSILRREDGTIVDNGGMFQNVMVYPDAQYTPKALYELAEKYESSLY